MSGIYFTFTEKVKEAAAEKKTGGAEREHACIWAHLHMAAAAEPLKTSAREDMTDEVAATESSLFHFVILRELAYMQCYHVLLLYS